MVLIEAKDDLPKWAAAGNHIVVLPLALDCACGSCPRRADVP